MPTFFTKPFATFSLMLILLLPISANAQSIPSISVIPPHGSISSYGNYFFNISFTPNTFGLNSQSAVINFTITPQPTLALQGPYVNELLTLHSNAGPTVSISPQTDCTRNNNILSCMKNYTFTANELSQSYLNFTVRYYADRIIPTSTIHWIGYSQGYHTIFPSNSGTPSTQICTVESNPMMPSSIGNGIFTFTIPAGDVCPSEFWIDPPIAGGYTYDISGAHFQSITMPSLQTVNDSSGYLLETLPSNLGPGIWLNAGEQHTFLYPIETFTIKGIDPVLALDPADENAFALGVELTAPTGTVTITQAPIVQDFPGLGPHPTGCNAWTQTAFLHAIKAQFSSIPSATYNLRVIIDPAIQQSVLADLYSVRSWRPDTREINLKVGVGYAGNGIDPDPTIMPNSPHIGVGTMTSTFRSNTLYAAANTWTGNAFQTNHWYRLSSKVNVMDYDNEWISPWSDNCLYQNVFVKVDPTGHIDLRVFNDLSGANGSPL